MGMRMTKTTNETRNEEKRGIERKKGKWEMGKRTHAPDER
jgi:hypothetical protein